MRRDGLPQWLTVLLVLVAVVVLGPPALVLVAAVIGLTIGIAAMLLKFGVVALAIFAVFALLRAVFGSSPTTRPVPDRPIERSHEEALARDEAELRALDAELARVMESQARTL